MGSSARAATRARIYLSAHAVDLGLALAFSLLTYAAWQVRAHGNLSGLAFSLGNAGIFALSFPFLFALCYAVVRSVWCSLDALGHHAGDEMRPVPFRILWLALGLMWLPWLLVQLPGTLSWDMSGQLVDAMNGGALSAHHPVFFAMLYGALFQFGFALGGVDAGILCITVAQFLVFSASIAFALHRVSLILSVPRRAMCGMVLFFGLVPVFPLFAVSAVKDTLTASTFLLFVVQMSDLALVGSRRRSRFISLPALLAVALGCCLMRYDSVFVVVPVLAAVGLAARLRCERGSFRPIVAAVLAFILLVGYNAVVPTVIDLKPGSIREALSLPIQQVGRYLKEYPDDLDAYEQATLDKAFKPALDEVAAAYTPYVADPVKGMFRYDRENIPLLDFLVVWARLGLRHPDVYLAHLIQGTGGYWDIGGDDYGRIEALPVADPAVGVVVTQILEGENGSKGSPFVSDGGTYAFPGVLTRLHAYVVALESVPVLSLLFKPAAYTWLAIILLARAFTRWGSRMACPALALVLKFGICLLSPLAGSMRYALPLVLCVPIMLCLAAFGTRPTLDAAGAGPAARHLNERD